MEFLQIIGVLAMVEEKMGGLEVKRSKEMAAGGGATAVACPEF